VPLFAVGERLVDHPAANTAAFSPLLAVAAVYALAALAAHLRGRPLAGAGVLAVVDVLLVAALVATSGGPFSPLRYAFFALPVGAALLAGPRITALSATVGVVLYTLIGVTFPADQTAAQVRFEVLQVLFLAWTGGAATALAAVLARRTREVEALAAGRGRLVAQALEAEDRARRRLAEALHDEALQNLLAARQLLDAGDADDLVREGLDQTVVQLRRAVFDLHPYLLEQAGLEPALRAVADRAALRAGFAVAVEVEPGVAGEHEQLLFSVARELIANAAKHSGAARLRVELRREGDDVVLEVSDDGDGVDPAAVRDAPAAGHIGLASVAERVEALGGRFTIGPRPGGGTTARTALPAHAAVAVG
jgi:two-component system NarL family sensor kinase